MSIQYGLISKNQIEAFRPLLPDGWSVSDRRDTFSIGAVNDGKACGILVFRADDLTADIQYLSVSESCRRQGIANGMIDFLCKTAWESGTAVLCTFSAPDRNAPLCRLFTRRGDFTLMQTEDYICRFPCRELSKVTMNVTPPAGCRIASFYRLPEDMQRSFLLYLQKNNEEFACGLQDDRKRMLEPLCLCTADQSEVQAAVFCQMQERDVLLSFAYSRSGHPRSLMALAVPLRDILLKAAEQVPYLKIAAVTPESRKLVDALLPGREVTARFYTACWDMNTLGG